MAQTTAERLEGAGVSREGASKGGCSPQRPVIQLTGPTSDPHNAKCSGHALGPPQPSTTQLPSSLNAPSALLPAQLPLCPLSSTTSLAIQLLGCSQAHGRIPPVPPR